MPVLGGAGDKEKFFLETVQLSITDLWDIETEGAVKLKQKSATLKKWTHHHFFNFFFTHTYNIDDIVHTQVV